MDVFVIQRKIIYHLSLYTSITYCEKNKMLTLFHPKTYNRVIKMTSIAQPKECNVIVIAQLTS